jgi:hypothetical protein
VEHLLPGRLAVSEKEVHALAPKRRSAQCRGGELARAEDRRPVIRVEVGEVGSVHARHDEHVPADDGLDVHEDDRALRLMDDGDFLIAGDESAEEAVSHRSRLRRTRRSDP